MSKIKWKPQTEIDEEEYLKSLEPSGEDVKKAQVELQTVAILEKLGVI